ncbi:MAG: integration host factor subunit beta [Acidobacteria bacterium]|nr:MAG: integration host factor subunit beta [Acidobacteriota bacterium]
MTKADLVEKIAAAAGLSKAEAEAVVKTVLDSIVEALRRKEKIELRGFGSFRLRQRRPRQGRNPKTGETVEVPGKVVPYFKPGKELREMLNPPGAAAPEAPADTEQGERIAPPGGDAVLKIDPAP